MGHMDSEDTRQELIDQLARINDYIAENFPDDYHADEDTADCVIRLLARLAVKS